MTNPKKPIITSPAKILFINLEGQIAGAENSLLLNIRYLPSRYYVQIMCPETGGLAELLRSKGVEVYALPVPPRRWNNLLSSGFYYLRANVKVLWVIINQRPCLIHANSTKAALSILLGATFMKSRIIWHVRDTSCPSWLIKICSMCSSKIIAVSKSIQSLLISKGVLSEQIEVVHNSLEISQGDWVDDAERNQRLFTFANIGQFVPWKNQTLFIDAAEEYLQKGMHARFLIVGGDMFGRDREYEALLQKRANESPYSDLIQIVPWQKDTCNYWRNVNCLVHTADTEPFGRVIIEAMEKRVPVVAANAFGPSEIIQHDVTGLLFEPNDISDLIQCMKTVSRNQNKAKEMALAGHRYVCQNHNIKTMVKRIHDIYDELLVA